MDQEQINSRKEYVEQVRQSFGEPESGHAGARGYRAYERTEDQTEDNMPGGFWKLRLIFSVLLFLVFPCCLECLFQAEKIGMAKPIEKISKITCAWELWD